MPDWNTAIIALATLCSSFFSGIFGMVGGAILLGVLLAFLPVPVAMTLHGVAQMASNGHRALLWHPYIMWRATAGYLLGSGVVFGVMALLQFSLPKEWIYLCLGILPFAALLVPKRHMPDIRWRAAPFAAGMLVMTMMLLAGIPGTTLDMFFQDRELDRRAVIATKAAMQTAGNVIKSLYFSFVITQQTDAAGIGDSYTLPAWLLVMTAALAIVGTALAKPILHRFSNHAFHRWSRWLILAVGAIYLFKGATTLVA